MGIFLSSPLGTAYAIISLPKTNELKTAHARPFAIIPTHSIMNHSVAESALKSFLSGGVGGKSAKRGTSCALFLGCHNRMPAIADLGNFLAFMLGTHMNSYTCINLLAYSHN